MKNSRPGEDWFARLLRWAEDGAVEAAPSVALADTLDEMTDALAAAAGACERTGAR